MKIITVVNQKGGVGKTATAVNIGVGLSMLFPFDSEIKSRKRKIGKNSKKINSRVLFVDTDPQCNLSYNFGFNCEYCKENKNVLDILKENIAAKETVQMIKPKINSKNDEYEYGIITGSTDLYGADSIIDGDDTAYRLKDSLESMADDFDICIIDTPPNLGILTINALTAADYAIIPAEADVGSLQGIDMLYETIEKIKSVTNPNLKILGIALTRYNGRTVISKDFAKGLDTIAQNFETVLFKTKIRECTAVKEARAKQISVLNYSGKSNAAADYEALSQEIYGMIRKDISNG